MKKIVSPARIQKITSELKARRKSLGFVPTMGALHEGHLSLIQKARKENDIVVVSIFVNPTQFGPKEDFKKYPRPQSRDLKLLKQEKVDFLFAPTVGNMYPEGFETFVELQGTRSLTSVLCGKSRPGHFRGVSTIVAKLLQLTSPTRLYMGQKDYQQAMVIERMIRDLQFDVSLKICPIVREPGGLALSSRNQYLSPKQRERAHEMNHTLRWVSRQLRTSKKKSLSEVRGKAMRRLRAAFDRVDYLEIVDPKTLQRLSRRQPKMVVLAAGFLGKTRLIDNAIIRGS